MKQCSFLLLAIYKVPGSSRVTAKWANHYTLSHPHLWDNENGGCCVFRPPLVNNLTNIFTEKGLNQQKRLKTAEKKLVKIHNRWALVFSWMVIVYTNNVFLFTRYIGRVQKKQSLVISPLILFLGKITSHFIFSSLISVIFKVQQNQGFSLVKKLGKNLETRRHSHTLFKQTCFVRYSDGGYSKHPLLILGPTFIGNKN